MQHEVQEMLVIASIQAYRQSSIDFQHANGKPTNSAVLFSGATSSEYARTHAHIYINSMNESIDADDLFRHHHN